MMINGGKSYVTSPPVFSNDAKKLLVCTSDTVSIFSTSTSLLIAELEGHKAPVTSVIVVPATTQASKILCYCYTSSLDGTIKYWDFSIPELIKTIVLQYPIHSMVIPGLINQPKEEKEKSSDLFAYIYSAAKKEQKNTVFGHLHKYNLTLSRISGLTLAQSENPGTITLSPCGKYIGVHEKRTIRIWEIPSKDNDRVSYKKMKLHHTKSFTKLAFHPFERIVAAGDKTGRILLYRGIGQRGKNVNFEEMPGVRGDDDADSCATWHWHSGPVSVLFFSSDGAYLYSGGKEGVLVVWQLDTGKKRFLPRIGSELLYYINSPDPTLSSISCADNRIHLLKMPSMEILRSISGIKPPMYESSLSGVHFDQSSGLVAVCAENYCIQLYSLFNDREISKVQICERNYQPGEEVTVIVNLVALSCDGSKMSTVETRLSEEGIGGYLCLKFWTCNSQSKSFSLSTVIYEPHRDKGISGIAFHPTRDMAVTTSYGTEFKIWVKDQIVENSGWTCHAIGSYKNKQMVGPTFSGDGSVLAVAAESVITLWDPERNILVGVIGETLEQISTLSFIGKSEYLVSVSQGLNPQICLWNMSKLSLSWSYKLHAQDVACSMDGVSFAVLAMNGVILLFTIENPVPIATWFVNEANGGKVAFISTKIEENVSNEMLVYVNKEHEYVLFDPLGEKAVNRSIINGNGQVAHEETGKFGYASIYGELPEFKMEKDDDDDVVMTSSSSSVDRPWESIFSGPSHTLPPLTKLCSAFLESLLERRITIVE